MEPQRGSPTTKTGVAARCWAGLQRDGFDGFEGAACFFWIPLGLQQRVGVGPRRPRAFMITRGVEDSSDAEPQPLLHDGLLGLIQSFLENVQGPLGLPGSVERHRGGVGKLSIVQQIGVGFHQRHRFVESAAALKGGKSAELASNAGWSALEEIQCSREITLVQTSSPRPHVASGQPGTICSACFQWCSIRRVFPHERGSARPVEAALDLRVVR